MALSQTAKNILGYIPSWMKMVKDEDSVGSIIVKAISKQIDEIYRLNNLSISALQGSTSQIDGFDILEISMLYKLKINKHITNEDESFSIKVKEGPGDSFRRLEIVVDLYKFYENENVCFYEEEEKTVYFKKEFEFVKMNDVILNKSDLIMHPLWGPLDEVGLVFNCPRIYGETNESYKERLSTLFVYIGNSSDSGIKNHLSRSLDLDRESIEVNTLTDKEYIENNIIDGKISDSLKKYIKIANRINKTNLNLNWRNINNSNKQGSSLPIRWNNNLENWEDGDIESGVTTFNDLKVSKPELGSNKESFEYGVYLEGLGDHNNVIYPEHSLKYKVYAEGFKYENGYRPESFKYTILASELIRLLFDVRAHAYFYSQNDLTFNETISSASGLDTSILPDENIVKTDGLKLTNGQEVMNPNARYIEIVSRLKPNELKNQSPAIDLITLKYTKAGIQKTLNIDGNGLISTVGDTVNVDFDSNTWDDASPEFRVRSDFNDSYRTEKDGASLKLSRGDYRKIINSTGDWKNGMSNDTKNVRITSSESLKLTF